eukprot:917375-Heterocapsa_arctica.AAC.1
MRPSPRRPRGTRARPGPSAPSASPSASPASRRASRLRAWRPSRLLLLLLLPLLIIWYTRTVFTLEPKPRYSVD